MYLLLDLKTYYFQNLILSTLVLGVLVIAVLTTVLFKPKSILYFLGKLLHYPVFYILILLIVGGVGFYIFKANTAPILYLNAEQTNNRESSKLKELQAKGFKNFQTIGVYLLDIRSRKDFAASHLKGSTSQPAESAAVLTYPLEKVDIIVYSTEKDSESAKKVGEQILKNGEKVKSTYKNPVGQVIVVTDGFEGLKSLGLETEKGAWD